MLRSNSTISSKVQEIKDNITQSDNDRIELKKIGKTIETHNTQLEDQGTKHEKYTEQIKKFDEEKKEAISEIKEEQILALTEVTKILTQAKEAMRLGTAAGISAGFQAQYNEIKGISNNKKNGLLSNLFKFFIGGKSWIWGALFFAIIAIVIGGWLVQESDPKLGQIYARLSLMFISLTGAWFCAGQYVKIFNIASDYAYKSTLAKSIDAFSETLKGNDDKINENYREYIKKILDEIHQHPLRSYKKQENVTPIEKVVEAVLDKLQK